MEAAIDRLRSEIEQCRSTISMLHATPGRVVFHQTVVRYLWWAVETADVILLAAEEQRVHGARPLLRHLIETLTEILLILSAEDSQDAAARVFVWDILDWEEERNRYKKVYALAPVPAFAAPPKQVSADDAFEQELSTLGAGDDEIELLQEVWSKLSNRRRDTGRLTHWTGTQSYASRTNILLERIPESAEEVRQKIIWAELFWNRAAYASHASPRRRLHPFRQLEDGRYLPGPIRKLDEKVRAQADMAADFLADIRDQILEFYGPPDQKS